jgi:hypothetical protein
MEKLETVLLGKKLKLFFEKEIEKIEFVCCVKISQPLLNIQMS